MFQDHKDDRKPKLKVACFVVRLFFISLNSMSLGFFVVVTYKWARSSIHVFMTLVCIFKAITNSKVTFPV